jgi:hypothetical protein
MSIEIGQTSQFQPAVVYDDLAALFHMLFVSEDSSNRLLHATSQGGMIWTQDNGPADVAGQTTHAAPALVLCRSTNLAGVIATNMLVAIFIANDPSNRVLYATLDLNEDVNDQSFRFRGTIPGESAKAIFALESSPNVFLYLLSNDPSNRLLVTEFTPQ